MRGNAHVSVFLARRAALAIPTLLGITLVTFVLLRVVPGDPASLRFSDPSAPSTSASAEAVAHFRAENLLDRTLAIQYLHYLGPFDLSARGHRWFGGDGEHAWHGLLAGDLGREYLRPNVSVGAELGKRLCVTVPLALISALLAFALAVPLGVLAALRRGSKFDVVSSFVLLALYAMPTFWMGLLLQLAFGSSGLGWLPVLGLHDKDASTLSAGAYAVDVAKHAVLPIACTTYASLAYISRQMRTSVLETARQDYVRAARAKGLPERVIVLRHIVRNSLLPTLTLVGSILPWLGGGSVIVETIFDIQGMGKYAYDSLVSREYDAVAGCVLVSAVMTLAGFLVSDLLYAWIDPRLRHE